MREEYLFSSETPAGDVFTAETTNPPAVLATGHGIDKSKRKGNTAGIPLARRTDPPKKRYSANELWLEGEPDYKQGKEYQEAKDLVKQRVINCVILTYGALGRYLASVNPAYVKHLDSVLDDLGQEGILNFDKAQAAPSKIKKAA